MPRQMKIYKLLKDLPYYIEPNILSIAGWLDGGCQVTALDQVEIENMTWIRHDLGWTLVRRGEYVFAEILNEKRETLDTND